jgi:hypothetical protein
MKHEREIHGFLEQSHISERNVRRLRTLAQSSDVRIAPLAALMLEVALIAPYRRRRIRTVARQRRDLLKQLEQAGLILPLIEPNDPYCGDPPPAWDEWLEYARVCGEG